MRRLIIPLALLLVLGLGVRAYAGSATSLLEPYALNMLEDDDYESGILKSVTSTDDATTLKVGDVLYGMLKVDPWVGTLDDTPAHNLIDQRFVTTNTFTGIFVVTVLSKTDDGAGGYDWTFGPAAAGDWSAATGNGYAPDIASTLLIAFDDDDAPSFINPLQGPTVANAMMTAADGIELWEFGFTQQNVNLFWRANTVSDDMLDLIGEPGLLTFQAALDVTQQGAGPSLLWFDWPLGVYSQVQFEGRNQRSGQGLFTIPTDSEIYLRPTPEPGTFALLGLGLAAFGAVTIRRRRNKV